MDIERLVVRLVADAVRYNAVMDQAESRIRQFDRAVAVAGVAALSMMAKAGLELSAEYERASVSMEVMLGNAEQSKKLLSDIQTLALESPFKSRELIVYAKELMAFGSDVNQIVPTMRALGDVAAGTGGRMDRIVLAFGQVQTAGRLMGQELRQFTNAGIPILEYLGKTLGKSSDQVRIMVHRGEVSFGMVVDAFRAMSAEGGRFHGMMEKINKETLAGRWENFVEMVQLSARHLGDAAVEGLDLKGVLTDLSEGMGTVDKSRMVEFWTGFRQGADAAWFGVKKLVSFLRDVWEWLGTVAVRSRDWLTEWVEGNQRLARVLAITLGLLVALAVAIKAVQIATAVYTLTVRGLVILIGVLTTVVTAARIALSLMNVVVAGGSLLSGLAAVVGAVLQLGATVLPILAVVAALTALVYILDEWGAFKDMGGDFLRAWGEIKSAALGAWEGIKEAVQAGDMENAFDVVFEGIKYAFKALTIAIRNEWDRFAFNMDTEVSMNAEIFRLKIQKGFMEGWAYYAHRLSGASDAEARAKASEYGEAYDVMIEEQRRSAKLDIMAGQPALDRAAAKRWEELAPQRASLDRVILRARVEARMSEARLKQVDRQIEEMSEVRQVPVTLGGPFSRVVGYRPQMEISPERFQQLRQGVAPPEVSPAFAAAGGGLAVPALEERYRAAWEKMFWFTFQMRQQAMLGKMDTPEFRRLQEGAADAAKEVGELGRQMGLFKGTVEELAHVLDVSPKAHDAANQLLKDIEDGLSPMEKFTENVRRLKEAYTGPAQGAFMALGGGAATVGFGLEHHVSALLGLFGEGAYNKGLVMEYEKLAKTVKPEGERLPPATLYGSREAQDIINRSMTESLTVEQEVLKTLREANAIARETAAYNKEVAAAMRKYGTDAHWGEVGAGEGGKGR